MIWYLVIGLVLLFFAMAIALVARVRPSRSDRRAPWSPKRKRLTNDLLDRMASAPSEPKEGDEAAPPNPASQRGDPP